MGYHRQKDHIQLAWLENRERVMLQLRQIVRRVGDEVLAELEEEFVAAINRGEILELNPSPEDLRRLVLKKAQKQLGPAE